MHGNGGHAAITRIVVPLTDAIREHWRTAAWLALAAAAAIATVSPVLALNRAGAFVLQPDLVRSADLLLPLTASAQSPAALQAGAIAQLLALLVIIAGAASAVAVVTALTIQWTRSGIRDVDTAVRRAVGASRRDLALSFLGEGIVIAVSAVPLGLLIGYVALRTALRAWPGTLGAWSYSPAAIALVTASCCSSAPCSRFALPGASGS
jgi:hypothetical protein